MSFMIWRSRSPFGRRSWMSDIAFFWMIHACFYILFCSDKIEERGSINEVIVTYICSEYFRSVVLDVWLSLRFNYADKTTMRHLKSFVENSQWDDMIVAIEEMIVDAAQNGTNTPRLPVSFLIRTLHRDAPAPVIRAILTACPGLAGECERFVTSIPERDRRHANSPKEKKDMRYPIHVACERINNGEFFEIVRALVNDYPMGASKKDFKDRLPIHILLYHVNIEEVLNDNEKTKELINITQLLLNAFPKSVEHMENGEVLPLDLVFFHIYNQGLLKTPKDLLKIAITMLQMYPKSARSQGLIFRNSHLKRMVLRIGNDMYWNTTESGQLLKGLIEGCPEAASKRLHPLESALSVVRFPNLNHSCGTILHIICSFGYSKDLPLSEEFVDAFRALLRAYPDAIQLRDTVGKLSIHCLLDRYYIPLNLIKAIIEACPDTIFTYGPPYDPLKHKMTYDEAPYDHNVEQQISERRHRNLSYYLTYKLGELHRRMLLESIINDDNSSIEDEENWKETMEYVLPKTCTNNPFGDGTSDANEEQIPMLHLALIHGPPFHAVEKLLQWYPSSAAMVDQYGMLPVHYASLSSYDGYNDDESSTNVQQTVEQVSVIFHLLRQNPDAVPSSSLDYYS